ncbi:hypothetical protein H8E77_39085 [bacterium]|nr:hypothetical protein [bacterium]
MAKRRISAGGGASHEIHHFMGTQSTRRGCRLTMSIAEGMLSSKREILIRLLRVKFDAVPETTVQRVESISSTDELYRLLEKIIHANSLSEMGLDGAKA